METIKQARNEHRELSIEEKDVERKYGKNK